jgi:hypothetical protein
MSPVIASKILAIVLSPLSQSATDTIPVPITAAPAAGLAFARDPA